MRIGNFCLRLRVNDVFSAQFRIFGPQLGLKLPEKGGSDAASNIFASFRLPLPL
jgi:hypothetical protein